MVHPPSARKPSGSTSAIGNTKKKASNSAIGSTGQMTRSERIPSRLFCHDDGLLWPPTDINLLPCLEPLEECPIEGPGVDRYDITDTEHKEVGAAEEYLVEQPTFEEVARIGGLIEDAEMLWPNRNADAVRRNTVRPVRSDDIEALPVQLRDDVTAVATCGSAFQHIGFAEEVRDELRRRT